MLRPNNIYRQFHPTASAEGKGEERRSPTGILRRVVLQVVQRAKNSALVGIVLSIAAWIKVAL